MALKTIYKSIEILAPREQVWTVLLDRDYFRQWSSCFAPGSSVEATWEPGSRVVFGDGTGNGMIGHVAFINPPEKISMEYDGILFEGRDDFESAEAQAIKGARETYTLEENAGVTKLFIESGMDEQYFDAIAEAWDEALRRVKALSENSQAYPERMPGRNLGRDVAGLGD